MPAYQKIVWIGLGVTVIAILVLGYFLFLAPEAEKKTVTVPEISALAKPQPTTDPDSGGENDPNIVPLDLDLDQSDAAVRDLVAAEEIPMAMKDWLQQKEIVRAVVAAVDNIAQGLSPAAQLPFLAPKDTFSIIEKNRTAILDPRSFRRYDHLVSVFVTVPDKTWITWYKKLRPTLEKAFKELGYPGVTFSQRLQQACEQLLKAPLVSKDIALEKKVLSFAFADINLEDLSPVQKHLLRMGPGNTARIQKKLRALAAGLNMVRKSNSAE